MEYQNQNYEDYMKSVLGYNPTPNNIYSNYTYNQMNDYYDMPYETNSTGLNREYLNDFYPESYRMIYPMVCKVCNQYGNTELTNDALESMVDNIYRNFEPEDLVEENRVELKNGDVRNPNAKQEVRKETRAMNCYLRDFIKVLLIRELLGGNRPPVRPPRPRPGFGPGPGPGRPPFPGGFGPMGPFNY